MGDYQIFSDGHAYSDGAEHDEPAGKAFDEIPEKSFRDLDIWQRLADAVAEAAQEHDRQTQPQFFNLSLAT